MFEYPNDNPNSKVNLTNAQLEELERSVRFWSFLSGVQAAKNFRSQWSMFSDNENLSKLFQKHDFAPNSKLVYRDAWFTENSDGKTVKEVSTTIDGDNWIDVWEAAERLIVASGDYHHIFIEEIETLKDGTLIMHTGS